MEREFSFSFCNPKDNEKSKRKFILRTDIFIFFVCSKGKKTRLKYKYTSRFRTGPLRAGCKSYIIQKRTVLCDVTPYSVVEVTDVSQESIAWVFGT
jgi:hypothetical protein